jgi:hypothetical protein
METVECSYILYRLDMSRPTGLRCRTLRTAIDWTIPWRYIALHFFFWQISYIVLPPNIIPVEYPYYKSLL